MHFCNETIPDHYHRTHYTSFFTMPTHSMYPEVVATVLVNGEELAEFPAEDEEYPPEMVVRYIEARPGDQFSAHVFVRGTCAPECALVITLGIDGEELRSRTWKLRAKGRKDADTTFEHGVSHENGQDMHYSFHFKQLESVDDVQGISHVLETRLPKAGHIDIQLHRISNVRTSTPTGEDRNTPILSAHGAVSEQALKGLTVSHVASLSAPEPISNMKWTDCDYVDGPGNPFAALRWKYRSREALGPVLNPEVKREDDTEPEVKREDNVESEIKREEGSGTVVKEEGVGSTPQ